MWYGLRPLTYRAIFALLASCGLRIGEVTRLARADVDLDCGVLSICDTKRHKNRFVPMHSNTAVRLGSTRRNATGGWVIVVTVPASFQAAQRQDTIAAAQRAGLALEDGELFDEPVAAFLAYLADVVPGDSDVLPSTGQIKNLVVFDFGGGTCDVAVFRLDRQNDGALTITPLNVSRSTG